MRSYFKKKKEKKRKKQMERELRRKKQFQYNQEKKSLPNTLKGTKTFFFLNQNVQKWEQQKRH